MKWKIAAVAVSFALAALLLTVFISGLFRSAFSLHRFDSASVIIQIKQLRQLVTVRYSIQRVVGLREPKVPFGEESLLLMVQGEVVAGVDLSRLTAHDIKYAEDRTATITLPAAQVFNSFLDEKHTQVWDRQITWWTPWVPYDPDLEHKARLQAIEDVRKAAMDMGILDQAQRNAQTAIREFLAAFQVRTEFKTRTVD